jgi:hypothetical protein
MDHSLGDAIGGRPFFENTLGNEILDFFVENQVNVIIPAHWRASFRVKTHSWGRDHGGFGRNARTAERLWWSVCSGQVHPAQRGADHRKDLVGRLIQSIANKRKAAQVLSILLLVSVAHVLQHRVKLAVHNQGNLDLDLAGQRCRTTSSVSRRAARFQWARDLRVLGSVRM